MTHAQFFGVPEGEFKVVINKLESVIEKSNKTLDDLGNEIDSGGMVSEYSFVEKEYTDKNTTPLSITIKKGDNAEDFECGKAVRVLLRTAVP